MRKMGWRKGSIGKDNDGIATAHTGQSTRVSPSEEGQTNRAGLGSKQGGAKNSCKNGQGEQGSESNRSASKDNTKTQGPVGGH
jgi:hypothetical protein